MGVLRCSNCGLAWRTLFDISTDYYTDLHVGESGVGEEKSITRLHNAEDRLVSLKKFLPQSGVCDIGCGDGSFLSVLKNADYRESWGIEPSTYAYSVASKKGLEVVRGDLSDLLREKQGKMLKALTLFHVIEHVPNPLDVFQTLREALPLGGILVLETPDADAAIQKITNHENALVYDEHLFYWTERSLRKALEQSGFRILKVSHRSFDWQHASLLSSLMRLGVIRRRLAHGSSVDHGDSSNRVSSRQPTSLDEQMSSEGSLLRRFVRKMLAHAVHLLRRDDYLLVVAERL